MPTTAAGAAFNEGVHMKTQLIWAVVAAAFAISGCSDGSEGTTTGTPGTGTLQTAMTFVGSTHDVAAMGYRVVAGDADCDDEAIAETVSPLEDEALPGWTAAAGGNHAFADALFVLQPGAYRVCVTPLQDDGTPSEVCAAGEGVFLVEANQTTEGVVYAQCDGDPSGGLDVIAALNNPPHIDDLDIDESKFITNCEEATITVAASDPDGDALNYAFAVTAAPPGANPILVVNGNQATFSTDVVGPYEVTVTVDDGVGGSDSLSFPIHVSECDDEGIPEQLANCALNPLWRPVECQTGEWVWSSNRGLAQNLADALANVVAFTGCTHANDDNDDGLCSLTGTGWVSTESYVMAGCNASWFHIGGRFTGICGGHDGDIVRRLVMDDDGCYDYRQLGLGLVRP